MIASVDIEEQARDMAEEKLLSSKAELKGFGGFFRKIWKHNLAHEYYRQKEIAKAKREIRESGNIYAGEKGEKADHESAMGAIVERFCSEYEAEGMLRRGEEKKILEDDDVESSLIKSDITALIGRFAAGTLTEAQFESEKKKLLERNFSEAGDKKGKKRNSLYVDNLLEIAKQVKDSVSHGAGLDALDLEFELVIGKARVGVETEPQFNAVDKIVDRIQKSFLGKFVNETTAASAVAIAHSLITKGAVGTAHKATKLAGPLGLGLSAGVGGAVAGLRESKRVKEERAQHAREMAKGGKRIEIGSERREEMEDFRHETRQATELTEKLRESLENLKSGPNEAVLHAVLSGIVEIDSRISFSEQEKIDLVGFSDAKKVEQERTKMYIASAEAKVYLKKNVHADWATFYNDEEQLKNYLEHSKNSKIQEEFLKEKTSKDKAFDAMKRKKVAWAVAKGVGVGLVIGTAAQEIGAAVGGKSEGLFNTQEISGAGQAKSFTALEYMRRYVSGNLPQFDPSKMQEISVAENFSVKVPKGLEISQSDDGSFNIINGGSGEKLFEGMELGQDGSLSAESKQAMTEAGIFPEEIVKHVDPKPVEFEAKEYIGRHEEMFREIKRAGWADNDTAAFDKNELRLRWGGEDGTGMDGDGNFVFNVKHMAPGGSFHEGKSWNPQELMSEGKMKLLVSLSSDTQNQVVEIPIDANGNALIDMESEIGKLAFRDAGGRAEFLGKFAEVAVVEGSVEGAEKVSVLATHIGEGVREIYQGEDVRTLVLDVPMDYDVELPYAVPILARTPLERLEETRRPKMPVEKPVIRRMVPVKKAEEPKKQETVEVPPAAAKKKKKAAPEKKKEETGKEKLLKKILDVGKERDTQATRAAAWHTIFKLENSADLKYDALNAPTKEEGDKKILELTKKLWDEFTVHNMMGYNPDTKKYEIALNESDHDGESCLMLLELAGIKVDRSKINFVNKGESSESGVIMDTSNNHGVISQENGKRLIFDHHAESSHNGTSATAFLYKTLVEMGLLKKTPQFDKYVEFITNIDNGNSNSFDDKRVAENYHRNLYGLYRKLSVAQIMELVEGGQDPADPLPEDYLKATLHTDPRNGGIQSLEQFSNYLKDAVFKAKQEIKSMAKEGFVVDTGAGRFGKVLVDVKMLKKDGRRFSRVSKEAGGSFVVKNSGYDGYLIWSPEENTFILYTSKKMDENSLPGGLGQGFNVRGHMWLKKSDEGGDLTLTIEDIFSKLSGRRFSSNAVFKNAMEKAMKKNEQAKSRPTSAPAQAPTQAPTAPPQSPPAPATPPAQAPVMPQMPPQMPPVSDAKQEKIAESAKNMAGLFSEFELSYDVIKEEAQKIQVSPRELALGFIESNPELKSQYETKLQAIPDAERTDKVIEKLALTVILEDEKRLIEEKMERAGEDDILRINLRGIKADIVHVKIARS